MESAAKKLLGVPFLLVAAIVLAGCSGAPKPPPPGVVEVTLQAAPDINPDANGQAAPVVVRIYHLASPEKFRIADFFSLFDNDKAALGADLVSREEVSLTPGESRVLTTPLEPNVRVVGIIAAYRDIEHATWRVSTDVPATGTTKLQANLSHLQVDLAKPGPQKPAS